VQGCPDARDKSRLQILHLRELWFNSEGIDGCLPQAWADVALSSISRTQCGIVPLCATLQHAECAAAALSAGFRVTCRAR